MDCLGRVMVIFIISLFKLAFIDVWQVMKGNLLFITCLKRWLVRGMLLSGDYYLFMYYL